MGFGGIPILILPLLFAAICANGYYTTVTGRVLLAREILVRVALVEALFSFPAFLNQQILPSLALSAITLVPILAITLAVYPLKKKFIDKRMAMM